jgi:formylglycine-generating enzyme required for sulfatase activity
MKEEGTYKDGKEDGLWTYWYENGEKKSEGTYKDGELNGLWTDWYENGQKSSEATYKDGEVDGIVIIWYEDGREIIPIIPEFVAVEGGTFQMGSNRGDSDEKPVHSVTVSDFNISKTEVTFEQYDAFCDATGRDKPDDKGWGRGNRPVIYVDWQDAFDYCEWMSKTTGETYRLPTEAEWEYAARGGSKSKGYTYSGGNNLYAVAWYDNNSRDKTHPVAQKQPNELGLYDMSGNVYEWCSDWYGDYSSSPQTDPQGSNSEEYRVLRGGGWLHHDSGCRVAFRLGYSPDGRYNFYGFRLVLSPDLSA